MSSQAQDQPADLTAIRLMEGGRYYKGALRAAVLKRDNHTCQLCGKKASDGNTLEVDHVLEFEDGGKTTYDNGMTVCQECNKGKSELKRHSDNHITTNHFSKLVGCHRNKVADAIQNGIIDIDDGGKIDKDTELTKWKAHFGDKKTDNHEELISTATELYRIPTELLQKYMYSFGRPSDYDPEMCTDLILIMAEGRSFTNAATLMGISHVTAYDWIQEFIDGEPNPRYKSDFSKAAKIGNALSELWWDEIGRCNLNNQKFNNTLYMMFRQNKHGWTRRLDGKIETTNHTIDEKRTIIEHTMNIQGEDSIAEIARILVESGAFKPAVERTVDATAH